MHLTSLIFALTVRKILSALITRYLDSWFAARRSVENQPKINWRLRSVSRRNDVRWKKKLWIRSTIDFFAFMFFFQINGTLLVIFTDFKNIWKQGGERRRNQRRKICKCVCPQHCSFYTCISFVKFQKTFIIKIILYPYLVLVMTSGCFSWAFFQYIFTFFVQNGR